MDVSLDSKKYAVPAPLPPSFPAASVTDVLSFDVLAGVPGVVAPAHCEDFYRAPKA